MIYPRNVQQKPKEDCKIKVKRTKTGSEISFSGNCTPSQVEIAKASLGDNIKVSNSEFED